MELVGRSYQLKWVARGRDEAKAQNSDECGSAKQTTVQKCADDKLLTQGELLFLL